MSSLEEKKQLLARLRAQLQSKMQMLQNLQDEEAVIPPADEEAFIPPADEEAIPPADEPQDDEPGADVAPVRLNVDEGTPCKEAEASAQPVEVHQTGVEPVSAPVSAEPVAEAVAAEPVTEVTEPAPEVAAVVEAVTEQETKAAAVHSETAVTEEQLTEQPSLAKPAKLTKQDKIRKAAADRRAVKAAAEAKKAAAVEKRKVTKARKAAQKLSSATPQKTCAPTTPPASPLPPRTPRSGRTPARSQGQRTPGVSPGPAETKGTTIVVFGSGAALKPLDAKLIKRTQMSESNPAKRPRKAV
eukprot:Hpha_TRINITY_DN16801_c3_g3::TRINITY_DN16801_c3_g3_i1::g.149541::m.149541